MIYGRPQSQAIMCAPAIFRPLIIGPVTAAAAAGGSAEAKVEHVVEEPGDFGVDIFGPQFRGQSLVVRA